MKLLYQASDAIEANLLKNLLEQANIKAYVHGEHLQGAVGELKAFGFVRLMVDEENYQNAKQIINDWNQAKIIDPQIDTT